MNKVGRTIFDEADEDEETITLQELAERTLMSLHLGHATRVRFEHFGEAPSSGVIAEAISQTKRALARTEGTLPVTDEYLANLVPDAWKKACARDTAVKESKIFSPITADAGIPMMPAATN